MQTLAFLQAFHDYSLTNGFSFYFEDKQFEKPEQMSSGNQLWVAIAIGSAFGLVNPGIGTLAVLNSGFYQKFNNTSFIEEIKRLKNHCDLIGMKDSAGSFLLKMAIVGDEMPDETIIGKIAIIHGLSEQFKKYSLTLYKSRFGEAKCGVMSSMYVVFASHKRAKVFFEEHARKCQHKTKNVVLFPSVVDLEDEEINYAGSSIFGLSYWGTQAGKMSKDIFKRKN